MALSSTGTRSRNGAPARVLISAGMLVGGGPRTHLQFLLTTLLARKFSVVVAATGCEWPETVVREFAAQGVCFMIPPAGIRRFPRLARLLMGLQWALRLGGRDFNSLYANGVGRSSLFLAWLLGAKVPTIYHEIVEAPKPGTIEAEMVGRFDFTVATSDLVTRGIRTTFPGRVVVTVPCLMEPAETGRPLSREKDRPLRVVYLGRLVRHKRPQELVRAWPGLRQGALARAELHLYGYESEPGVRQEIDHRVAAAGSDGGIFVHGPYEPGEIGQIMRAADLVVLPSLMEGLPTVLIEAMFFGVPFVACAAGGTADLADDNPDVAVCGFDWAEFCAALSGMAQRIRSGEIDRERLMRWARARFGREIVEEKWISLLRNPQEYCQNETAAEPRCLPDDRAGPVPVSGHSC